MIKKATAMPGEREAFAGDIRCLLEQLGSPEQDLWSAKLSPALRDVNSLPCLRSFLDTYQMEMLIPVELPAIFQAYRLTCTNQCRELVGLDQRLSAEPRLAPFAVASQRVGQNHLARLRPLRDHRVVQRYLHAIENREALGWHTLVYGVLLAVFSLPLRQGLTAFANQTLAGFAARAARTHRWDENSTAAILDQLAQTNALAVEKLFTPTLHIQ
jgi:urease accessory protein UreF